MQTFADFFTDRQLYVHGVIVEEFRKIRKTMIRELGRQPGEELARLMGLAVSKCVDRNSRMTRWVPQREVIANTFDRHDFSFKWTFAEFDGAVRLLPWAVNQIRDAAAGISGLVQGQERPAVTCGNGA
jgi:adenine-specific DNA methylase